MVARAKAEPAAEEAAEPVVSEEVRKAIAEEVAKVLADHDEPPAAQKEEKADEPGLPAGPREQEADMAAKVRAAVEQLKKEDAHAAEHEQMKAKAEPEEPPPARKGLRDRLADRLWS